MCDRNKLSPEAELSALFHLNGYVRWQDYDRSYYESHYWYKKGDEIRLVASSEEELCHIYELLEQAKFRPGRFFAKGRQFRIPIYGRDQVDRFLKIVFDKA
jgi:hypothetical protein